jgi:hypothetical protein
MNATSSCSSWAAISLVLASSCSGGTDTEGPSPDRGRTEEGDLFCEQTVRGITFEEVSPLGYSVQEVLTWLAGEHHDSLLWMEKDNPSLGPEHGRSEISLDVEPLAARFIRRTSRVGDVDFPQLVTPQTSIVDSLCHDSIALDVSLHISTAGGALAETVQTILEVRASDFARGQLRIPTDSLTSSLRADLDLLPGFTPQGAPNLVLDLRLSSFGLSGQLSMQGDIVSSDGRVLGQGGSGILAHFPADDSCPTGSIAVPADRTIRGVSAASVLQQLRDSSPMQLEGSMERIEIVLESNARSLCAILDSPAIGAVEFPGSVTIASRDQRIGGKIDVILAGQAAEGVQSRSGAFAATLIQSPLEAAAAVSKYAIRDSLDFTGYAGYAFRFATEVMGTDARGELRVDGVRDGDCAATPSVSDSEGLSSPPGVGCQPKPLWLSRWSQQR